MVVLMFVFGLIEICRLMLTYTTLAEAARAGLRYASTHGNDRFGGGTDGPSGGPGGCGSWPYVSSVVTSAANAAGLAGTLTVSVCYATGNSIGNSVSVTVNYPYNPIISFIGLAPTINLTSTTQGAINF
jgi:hypothetical protein